MATTALNVITRALKRLRVLSSGETPTAEEAADCLDALNEMIAEWRIDGIDLASIELATTDTLDVPADHILAIVLNLARRVGGMFGAQLSGDDLEASIITKDALVAYHFTIAELGSDHPLAQPRSACDE